MKKLFKKRWLKKVFKKRKGFSLHEIITVLVIIGILITATVVYAGNIRINNRDTKRLADVGEIHLALQLYQQDNGVFPASLPAGQALVSGNGKVYLPLVPANPQPHADGDCPDEGYGYTVSEDGLDYALSYCLGNGKKEVEAGKHIANKEGLNCKCPVGYSCKTGRCEIAFGEFWTKQLGSGDKPFRGGLACNKDCSKIAAATQEEQIGISLDGGVTWNFYGTSTWQYSDIAASSDLSKLAVAVKSGRIRQGGVWVNMNYIHTSNDSGKTWIPRTESGLRYWSSVASSSDGNVLIAGVGNNGYLYISKDSGATWTENAAAGLANWSDVDCSANGQIMAATDYVYPTPGYIRVSTNGGQSWTTKTEAGLRSWTAITMSSDGKKMYAVANSDYIYASTDYGNTWSPLANSDKSIWWDISTSSDGKKVVATANNGLYGQPGGIYTSQDSGKTWVISSPAELINEWDAAVVSANGSKIVASHDDDYLYTSP